MLQNEYHTKSYRVHKHYVMYLHYLMYLLTLFDVEKVEMTFNVI